MNHNIFETYSQNSPHMSWLKDKTILLTITGSRGYGTNIATSDYDYKGIAIPPQKYYFSMQHTFDQAELSEPDAVIYEIKKYLKLASTANPNCLDVLFADPENIIVCNSLGQKLIDNRDLFITKAARYSYAGYSFAQLKRIKNHRGYLLNPLKEPPTRKEMGLPETTLIPADQLAAAEAEIKKELDKINFDFLNGLDDDVKIAIKTNMQNMLTEMKVYSDDQWSAMARKIGFSDNFIYLLQQERNYSNKKREWEQYVNWKKNRNSDRAKDEEKFGYDGKHAYHLIRLLRMCIEILESGKVIVKRPDFEDLLEIRNGLWSYDKLIEEAEKLDKKCEELYKISTLPNKPNINKIDELGMELIIESLKTV